MHKWLGCAWCIEANTNSTVYGCNTKLFCMFTCRLRSCPDSTTTISENNLLSVYNARKLQVTSLLIFICWEIVHVLNKLLICIKMHIFRLACHRAASGSGSSSSVGLTGMLRHSLPTPDKCPQIFALPSTTRKVLDKDKRPEYKIFTMRSNA